MKSPFKCENPFCNSLDEHTLRAFCNAKIRFKLNKKQEGLFAIGEGQIVLVDQGALVTVRSRSDGRQKAIEILKSGDFLGLSQLFNKVRPITIAILAKKKMEGCIFSKEFLEDFCMRHPAFQSLLFSNLARRFSEAITQIEHISLDNSTHKMRFALARVNALTDEHAFTHEDLAIIAGINRVTATKALQILRREGQLGA